MLRVVHFARRVRVGLLVIGLAMLLIFVPSVTLHAQAAASSERGDSETYDYKWHRDQCLGGLTYGAPLKLAVSWAGGLRKELKSGQAMCAFVSPKLGLGGARLGAGLMRTFGSFGGAYGASGGIIRTFGAPSYADRQSVYAGGSVHVMPLLAIGVELGWYGRLGGVKAHGRESIIALSLGVGF